MVPPLSPVKAWAIGDAETGELLWGDKADQPLHPASTTKIMTAFLAVSLAEQDPAVMEEVVTFSKRADETIGSSCRLEAGERVSVGELLYGLLLPSGNDASVALAEHLGARFDSKTDDGFAAFVQAMNDKAKALGMRETAYRNTHGLTEEGHLTSARDLLKLSHAALRLPEFEKRTQTVQRGCRVQSTDGYQRNVVWKNTNRLLGIDGFDGVKTGTTSAAGCCLVSRGHHPNRSLIVVVLGSSCSDSRYTDSKNLYRWAWRKLQE